MKTTIDLPDALVKAVKLRAVREGQKLKDAFADVVRRGLTENHQAPTRPAKPLIKVDKKTGLPVVQCRRAAAPSDDLTAERVAEILLAQDIEWHDAATR